MFLVLCIFFNLLFKKISTFIFYKRKGNKVLIVAHGNSIRALIKHLDNVSDDDIVGLDIPTGIPLVYEIDKETFTPIKHYYLADEETVKKACSTVANQSKLKS